jgi:hypothetical protein
MPQTANTDSFRNEEYFYSMTNLYWSVHLNWGRLQPTFKEGGSAMVRELQLLTVGFVFVFLGAIVVGAI